MEESPQTLHALDRHRSAGPGLDRFSARGPNRDAHPGETSPQHRGTEAERVYLITSLRTEEAGAAELAAYSRGHWGIENRLHFVRDSTVGEDKSQIHTGNALHVMDSPAQPGPGTAPPGRKPGHRQSDEHGQTRSGIRPELHRT